MMVVFLTEQQTEEEIHEKISTSFNATSIQAVIETLLRESSTQIRRSKVISNGGHMCLNRLRKSTKSLYLRKSHNCPAKDIP